jgi:hypothetical protein
MRNWQTLNGPSIAQELFLRWNLQMRGVPADECGSNVSSTNYIGGGSIRQLRLLLLGCTHWKVFENIQMAT